MGSMLGRAFAAPNKPKGEARSVMVFPSRTSTILMDRESGVSWNNPETAAVTGKALQP